MFLDRGGALRTSLNVSQASCSGSPRCCEHFARRCLRSMRPALSSPFDYGVAAGALVYTPGVGTPCAVRSRGSSSTNFWVRVTCLCTVCLSATTQQRKLPVGRACQWHAVCAAFCVLFLLCQQSRRVSVYIDHIPGIMNDIADALSREVGPSTLGFAASEELSVMWESFPSTPELNFVPPPPPPTSTAFFVRLASAQLDLFLWLFPRLWSSVSARDDIWFYSRRIDS